MAIDVGTLVMKFKSDDQKALGSLKKMGKSLKTVGMIGATALTAIGGASLKTAADFEKGMSKVQAITDSTDEEMKKLEESAKNLGATTAFSAKEAAEGMSFLGMAGFETNEIIEAMPGLLDLAAASGTDLALTADIVSDALSAFKLEAKDTGMFSDVLAKAASSANVSVQTLGESFKYAAPIAGAMGFSVQDVTAALGAMGNKGIKASQAGTALRTAMTKMSIAAEDSNSELSKMVGGLTEADGSMKEFSDIIVTLQDSFATMTEAQKASTAESLFGKNAMTGMLAILDDTNGEYMKLKENLDSADGSAKKMADTMLNNLSGQMTLIKSATEGVAIEIGQILIPIFMELTQFIQTNMPTIKKVLVTTFDAITTGAKMVWDFFNNFMLPIFSTLYDWIQSNMPAIQSTTDTVFSKIVEVATSAYTFFKDNLLPIFVSLMDWVSENMPAIQSGFDTAISAVVEVATTLYNFFRDNILPILVELYSWVEEFMPQLQTIFGIALDFVINVLSKLWTFIKENLLPVLASLFDWVQEQMPMIKNIIKTALDIVITVFGFLSEAIQKQIDMIAKLVEFFEPAFKLIGEVAKKNVGIIIDSINNVVGAFKTVIDWAEKAIRAVKEFFGEKSKGDLSVPSIGGGSRTSGNTGRTIRGNRANGGEVKAGESYIVGERGMETFTPSTNGFIGANKPAMINININGNQDPNMIGEQIVRILNEQGITRR